MKHKYPIGTKFTLQLGRKSPKECTVTELLTTTNSKGEVVKIRYVVQYPFFGRTATNSDICETTITRSLWKQNERDSEV